MALVMRQKIVTNNGNARVLFQKTCKCPIAWNKRGMPPVKHNPVGFFVANFFCRTNPRKRIEGIKPVFGVDLKRGITVFFFLFFSRKQKLGIQSRKRKRGHFVVFTQLLAQHAVRMRNSSSKRINRTDHDDFHIKTRF